MYKIIKKKELNATVTLMEINAPYVAAKAKPGQFIILRVDENGERIPLTIADYNRESGTITIIFQTVGDTTERLNQLTVGEEIQDFVGPLGNPSQLDGLKKVAVVGGGVGSAIAYPIAKQLYKNGAEIYTITGFRSQELVILEHEFNACSSQHSLMTDDGSVGQKGLVTEELQRLIEEGNSFDAVIAIGPLVMMKYVCEVTKKYNIKTIVSMNPIMIDGTGMCGGCRLSVDGKMKFACVDGPDFDGHLVDFDEAINRMDVYRPYERKRHRETCNLLRKGV